MKFSLLINMKMPTIVGIFIFISRENFMLSWVEHEKSFMISGPDQCLLGVWNRTSIQICYRQTVKTDQTAWMLVGWQFNGPVNTIKVMLSQSVYLTTLFLDRLSPLSGYPVLVHILSPGWSKSSLGDERYIFSHCGQDHVFLLQDIILDNYWCS